MATYELVTFDEQSEVNGSLKEEELGSAVLLYNALWFTKVRWIVIIIFITIGLLALFSPQIFRNHGLVTPTTWPWIFSVIMILMNVPLRIFIRRLNEYAPQKTVAAYIWVQIVLDLIVLTGLVYVIGSTDTFVPFFYLFHITLACIFFPPRSSLIVTCFSAVLYFIVVLLEINHVLPVAGIRVTGLLLSQKQTLTRLIFAGSAVFVWLVVWYFVSTLSAAVRKRDKQLREANVRLIKADEEKTQQVLVTTHELKSPFTGIESNIQLLKYQYWKNVPGKVQDLINKIDAQSQILRERISKILMLGDLRSLPTREKQIETLELDKVIVAVIEDLKPRARERNIKFDVKVPSFSVQGNKKNLTFLFSNLLSNAVNYSHDGARVEVVAREYPDRIEIAVSDHGIGIREDALPHIFDEYYRTKEASAFNKMSTGLGLSIVKEIVRNLGLGIRVSSTQGKGTTFEVVFPIKNKLRSLNDGKNYSSRR